MRIIARDFGLFSVLAVMPLFVGCSTVSELVPVTAPAASSRGNWNIVGTGAPTSFPSLSFSLISNGNQLYASGPVQVSCNNAVLLGGGGGVNLTGEIASDGTFQLTDPAGIGLSLGGDPVQIVVSGTVPQSVGSSWAGTYSITTPAGSVACAANETGSFVAAPYVTLDGTYAGPLVAANTGATGVSVSVNVMQGAPVDLRLGTPNSPQNFYYLPVSGTASVSGIQCFTHGSTDSSTSTLAGFNSIGGSSVEMTFVMDDGSHLVLNGTFADTQESSLNLMLISVIDGQCSGGYSGTLTRQ
jgi:hypothetical protein